MLGKGWWRKRERVTTTPSLIIIIILLLLLAATATALFFILHSSSNLFTIIITNNNNNNKNDTPPPLYVPLTLLTNATHNRAFCLDGSLPGYHFHTGFGSGSNSWLLHIEGGGWCDTIESCSARKKTALGSSNHMDKVVQFSGILSNDPSQNPGKSFNIALANVMGEWFILGHVDIPDFFNWNKVKIRYCDGASFAGRQESELKNGTELFFRGQLIWEAVMGELLSLGLSNAAQALLSGCSAGGLATLIHCDGFREYLPKGATVKCLADAAFFLNVKDIAGHDSIALFYHRVVHLQGVTESLNKDCVATMEPHKCFFPQEFIKHIKTPIFLVQPGYDFWQIKNIFVSDASSPRGSWFKCQLNIRNCDPGQMKVLQGYRDSLLSTLSEFQQNNKAGAFVNSCFIHCQTWFGETWHSSTSPRINNMTIAESVGQWYFDRKVVRQIDCLYPCNPTCYHMDFTRGR